MARGRFVTVRSSVSVVNGVKVFLKALIEFTLLKNLQQNQKLYVYAYELLIGMKILDILIVIVF